MVTCVAVARRLPIEGAFVAHCYGYSGGAVRSAGDNDPSPVACRRESKVAASAKSDWCVAHGNRTHTSSANRNRSRPVAGSVAPNVVDHRLDTTECHVAGVKTRHTYVSANKYRTNDTPLARSHQKWSTTCTAHKRVEPCSGEAMTGY